MTPEELVQKYRKELRFTAAKAWQRYNTNLIPRYGTGPLFDGAQLDAWAIEALLILGGLYDGPGLGKNAGRLAEFEADGRADFIQHSLDLYVSAEANKVIKIVATKKRGGGEVPVRLDQPTGEHGTDTIGSTLVGVEDVPQDEELEDLYEQYPILVMTRYSSLSVREAARTLGIPVAEARDLLDDETSSLHARMREAGRVSGDWRSPWQQEKCSGHDGDEPCALAPDHHGLCLNRVRATRKREMNRLRVERDRIRAAA